MVATDHCAFTTKQKRFGVGDFTKIPNGTGGLEDRLPVLWTKGVNTGRLTMNEFVAVTSTNIAKILNMYPKKGAIVEGADADIVVWDPKRKKTITAKKQQSVIDYNVFEGFEVTGLPRFVFSRGELLIQESEIKTKPGHGAVRRPRGQPAGQPRAVEMERGRGAAQGRAHRHSGRGLTRLTGRLSFVLIALSLSAAVPAAAQTLDIAGPYGNADGCKYAKDGHMSSDDMLLLKPDGFESYGTACEFVAGAYGQGWQQGGDRALPFRGRGRFRHAELRDPEEPEGPRSARRLRYWRGVCGSSLPACRCSLVGDTADRRSRSSSLAGTLWQIVLTAAEYAARTVQNDRQQTTCSAAQKGDLGGRACSRPTAPACEFVEVLAAKDGSKVVTGLCQFEGEDGFGTLSFVVRKSPKDPAALIVYNSDGSVFGEVSPCP